LRPTHPSPLILAQLEDVLPAVADLTTGDEARRGVQDAPDGLSRDRLARAGLTEDGEGLTLTKVKGHAIDGVGHPVPGAEFNAEVLDFEQQPVLRLPAGCSMQHRKRA